MATGDYIQLVDLKAALRIDPTNTAMDVPLQLAISAASRQIDQHCDDRFYADVAPVARVFKTQYPRQLFTPAFATTAGLVVEVDYDNDGTFEKTLIAGTDYQVVPTNPEPNRPYRGIETLGSSYFPGGPFTPYYGWAYGYPNGYYGTSYGGEVYPYSNRARVRVTATWGWPTVPYEVQQACLLLAIDHYKGKDLTNGVGGPSGISTGAYGSQKTIHITPAGFNPQARALLCGLRETVIA